MTLCCGACSVEGHRDTRFYEGGAGTYASRAIPGSEPRDLTRKSHGRKLEATHKTQTDPQGEGMIGGWPVAELEISIAAGDPGPAKEAQKVRRRCLRF